MLQSQEMSLLVHLLQYWLHPSEITYSDYWSNYQYITNTNAMVCQEIDKYLVETV